MGGQRRRGRQHGGQPHDHRIDDQLRGMQEDRLCREHRRQPGLPDRDRNGRRQHLHALQPHPALAQRRAARARHRSRPFRPQRREVGHDHQLGAGHGGGHSAQGEAHRPADRRRHLHLRHAHRLRTADPQGPADADQRGLRQRHGRQPHGEVRIARARHRGRAHLPLHQHDLPLPAATAAACPTVRANFRASSSTSCSRASSGRTTRAATTNRTGISAATSCATSRNRISTDWPKISRTVSRRC